MSYFDFLRKKKSPPHHSYSDELNSEERTPLIPEQHDEHHDTALQASLHKKLHGYLILRALRDGYLPSTEQFVRIMEEFGRSEVFQGKNLVYCSRDTKEFVKLMRGLLQEVVKLVETKNAGDELQELIWWAKKARIELNFSVNDEFSMERVSGALGQAAKSQLSSANASMWTSI